MIIYLGTFVIKVQDLASALKTLPHDQLSTSLDALLRTIVSRFINQAFPSTESTSQAYHVFEYLMPKKYCPLEC